MKLGKPNAIDEDEYAQIIADVVMKWKRMHSDEADDRQKLFRYMLTCGFSIGEVMAAMNNE